MPDRFIEIAEETGAILPIGRWVLREACREAAALARARAASRRDCSSASTCRPARSSSSASSTASRPSSRESGLDPTRLVLEITETALLKATPTTVATLARACARSASGPSSTTSGPATSRSATCASSRSTRSRSPASSSRTPTQTSKSSALAGAIVAMSRSLGIETVAEGIETAEQAERMRDLGCPFGQGYAFARPMPEADLLAGFGTAAQRRSRPSGCLGAGRRGPDRATTSGRREANGRAANASRRPASSEGRADSAPPAPDAGPSPGQLLAGSVTHQGLASFLRAGRRQSHAPLGRSSAPSLHPVQHPDFGCTQCKQELRRPWVGRVVAPGASAVPFSAASTDQRPRSCIRCKEGVRAAVRR